MIRDIKQPEAETPKRTMKSGHSLGRQMELARTQLEDLGAFKMFVSLDDDVSRDIHENRWYSDEQWETSVFVSHLQRGMSVLDLGGNIGFYTMMARSIIGPEGRVVTFEPYPRSAALIRASIEANGYKNVTESLKIGLAGRFKSSLPDQSIPSNRSSLDDQRDGHTDRLYA